MTIEIINEIKSCIFKDKMGKALARLRRKE